MIIQGDQYRLPFSITEKSGTVITPELAAGVILQLGQLEFTYPDGGITFEDGKWGVWLSQEATRNLPKAIDAEIKVKFKDEPETIKGSVIKRLPIQRTIIQGSF